MTLSSSREVTLDGFFAFQVADASAPSIRNPGKEAIAVDIPDTRRGQGGGLLLYHPPECHVRLLSQKQAMCLGLGQEF